MRTIILIVILVTIASAVMASYLEVDQNPASGSMAIQGYFEKKCSDRFGIFALGCYSKEWSEFYVGPMWAPNDNFLISVGIGREQASDPGRTGGSVWYGSERFSATYLWEDGGSGRWDKADIAYQAFPKLGIGLTNRIYTRFEKGLNGVFLYSVDKTNQVKISVGEAGGETSWIISF